MWNSDRAISEVSSLHVTIFFYLFFIVDVVDPPEKEEDEGPLGKYCLTAQHMIFASV